MDKLEFHKIDIVITGNICSGKTAVLHIICGALKAAGLNVAAVDDVIGEITEFHHGYIHDPDERVISVSTSYRDPAQNFPRLKRS